MNHTERAKLRERAAQMVERGTSLSDVAQHFQRTAQWVKTACAEHSVEVPRSPRDPQSYSERAAEMVSGGAPVDAVADHFSRSVLWVERSCVEQGVPVPGHLASGRNHAGRTLVLALKIVAALLKGDETYTAIGESLGVTRQRVEQIAHTAREAGIALPRRKRGPKVNDSKKSRRPPKHSRKSPA